MSAQSARTRTWLITGATSGIGGAIAAAALQAGDTVVAAVRHPERFTDLASAHPGRGHAAHLDVTDAPRIEEVVAETVDRHGRIDVIVNAAGAGSLGPVKRPPRLSCGP
jgi:NADP-dependent 3-hydroxy acid dehydrogenase YdfG